MFLDILRCGRVSRITLLTLLTNGETLYLLTPIPVDAAKNRKSSDGRKIARIARIRMIFGPNRSQRRELKFENFSNERTNKRTNETSENFAKKNSEKNLKKFSDVNRYRVALLFYSIHQWICE